MDTIFAQATAQGRAGVSVIRISGPEAVEIVQKCCGRLPKPRVAALCPVKDASGGLIDQALVLFFPAPHSFTGEDVVELHLHGSIAIMQAVLEVLATFTNTRIAEAGEFTRRALENEKLDLTQVEGLADLIESETEIQRKQAMNVLSGKLGKKVETWRSSLIRAAALLEATIDFVDEEVPVDVTPEVRSLLSHVGVELSEQIRNTKVAERIRAGFEVAIIGPPNAGKSTLLNALAGRDAAITSSTAGTTRDVIEVRMNLGGLPVTLLDTAGLRETKDEIEAQGVSRAIDRAKRADLRIFLMDEGSAVPLDMVDGDISVFPKADERQDKKGAVSGRSGEGVDDLIDRVQKSLGSRIIGSGLATHERHRIAMVNCADHLEAAVDMLGFGPDHYEITSAELRFAITALETLVGRIDTENLLDEIFTSFCLGK